MLPILGTEAKIPSGTGMPDSLQLPVTEYFRYSVSYLGIRIGTIEVRNETPFMPDPASNIYVTGTQIILRTFPGIPFLSVLTEFLSSIDDRGFFRESTTYDKQGRKWAYYEAVRDNETNDIVVERGSVEDRSLSGRSDIEVDTLHPGIPVHDALTFIQFLRNRAHETERLSIDILIDRSIEKIVIDQPSDVKIVKIKAFDEATAAYHVTGSIEFTAIHGLSRRYQAWISTGPRRIPLMARVHIAIGSVKIELESYDVAEHLPHERFDHE